MTRKNERQISKKTVSFRIREGESSSALEGSTGAYPKQVITNNDRYPSKRTIEYNDIMDRYDITGNNAYKENEINKTKKIKNKNVVDNILKVKNDTAYNQEEGDDSEYSDYNDSKAPSSSSPAKGHIPIKHPPPPPPQIPSNLSGLEETIDSLNNKQSQAPQRQRKLPPQTLLRNKSNNPYNRSKSTTSISEIESELHQTQHLLRNKPVSTSMYQHPMDESYQSTTSSVVNSTIFSEASSSIFSNTIDGTNQEQPIPKTKSFLTRLTNDALRRDSMTQSDYEIQAQLSILGKLGKNARSDVRFNQYSEDDLEMQKHGIISTGAMVVEQKYSEDSDDEECGYHDAHQEQEQESSPKKKSFCPNPFAKKQPVEEEENEGHAYGDNSILEEQESSPKKKSFCPNPFAKKQPVVEEEYSSSESEEEEEQHVYAVGKYEEEEEPQKKRFGCPNPFAKKQPVEEYESSSHDENQYEGGSSEYSDDDEQYTFEKKASKASLQQEDEEIETKRRCALLCCFSGKQTMEEQEINDMSQEEKIKEFYSDDDTTPEAFMKRGRLLAGLSTNQPMKTRIICMIILVLLFIVGITSISMAVTTVQSNAQEQAIAAQKQMGNGGNATSPGTVPGGDSPGTTPGQGGDDNKVDKDDKETEGATDVISTTQPTRLDDIDNIPPDFIPSFSPIAQSSTPLTTPTQGSSSPVQSPVITPTLSEETPSLPTPTQPTIPTPTAIAPTPSDQPISLQNIISQIISEQTNTTSESETPSSEKTNAEQNAYQWLIKNHNDINDLNIFNQYIGIKQRYNLAIFYYATSTSTWTHCGYSQVSSICTVNNKQYYRWLSSNTNHCYWYGITCDDDGLITSIILDSNNLAGYLPHQIFLTSLIRLSLRYNFITSNLPQTQDSKYQLRTLLLNNNLFNGTLSPNTFIQMNNLQTISLGNNQFSGTISNLVLPPNLIYLNIRGNGFSGSIPVESLFNTTLQYVDLGSNAFSGTVSVYWGVFKKLRVLTLYNNFFSGTLASEILELHTESLEELSVGMNELTGSIPILSTSSSSKLTYLNLGTNQLSGSIQSDFGDVFPNLQSLILWQNELTGTIPTSIGGMQSLEMFQLPYNNIIGSMPAEVCNLRDGGNLDILSADCKAFGGDVQVSCDCCTTCYSGY